MVPPPFNLHTPLEENKKLEELQLEIKYEMHFLKSSEGT
jgi:hypothetical protein